MSFKYQHLLSPIQVGNVVLKNRLLSTKAIPAGLQGADNYPNDAMTTHLSNVARAGAAIVTCHGGHWVELKGMDMPQPKEGEPLTPEMQEMMEIMRESAEKLPKCYGQGMTKLKIQDSGVQGAYANLADQIHYYGSLASISMMDIEPQGLNIDNITEIPAGKGGETYRYSIGPAATEEQLDALIDEFVDKAKLYKLLGFDMVSFYMSYRASLLAQSLSPAMNHRTDKYGGSFEKRAYLTLELFRRVKEACGKDFLIEAQITGEEEEGGYTLDDFIRYAKMCEGLVDIFQIRAVDGKASHPIGFNSTKEEPATLRYAAALKASGCKILTAPVGGFQDLDIIEKAIAEGKTDMVAMGRAFIADYDYLQKAIDGHGEDVTPCIRCNKCHGGNDIAAPGCSVNPLVGIAHKASHLENPVRRVKKVAVVGGGPAGMRAAILCAERGHNVTLYEAEKQLGGQLIHADYAKGKWPLKEYKDWEIRQIEQKGIAVKLGVTATAELLADEHYDTIIAATGATANIPAIPGAEGDNVWTPLAVYGNEQALGRRVVVIGGSETGSETGLYLAECGHQVTILSRQRQLIPDAQLVHYKASLEEVLQDEKNLTAILKATTVEITQTGVWYLDRNGQRQFIEADSVVLSGGVRPRQKEAVALAGAAPEFYLIGDAKKPGDIKHSTRTAYAAASLV